MARRAFAMHSLQLHGSFLAISSLRVFEAARCNGNFSGLRDLLRVFSSIVVGLVLHATAYDSALIVREPDLDSSDVLVLPNVARV